VDVTKCTGSVINFQSHSDQDMPATGAGRRLKMRTLPKVETTRFGRPLNKTLINLLFGRHSIHRHLSMAHAFLFFLKKKLIEKIHKKILPTTQSWPVGLPAYSDIPVRQSRACNWHVPNNHVPFHGRHQTFAANQRNVDLQKRPKTKNAHEILRPTFHVRRPF
jgi:hypothetical protein